MLLCETVVDLQARLVGRGGRGVQRRGLNRVQHLDRQCTRQQNYVLDVYANNNYCHMIVNQCGAGWGALRVLEPRQ